MDECGIALALTGSAPDVAAPGARVVAEWVLTNDGPTPLVANFFMMAAPAPIARFACRGGRTQVGRYHASAVVPVAAGGATTVTALLGPLPPGRLAVGACAVTDEDETAVDLCIHVGRPAAAVAAQ